MLYTMLQCLAQHALINHFRCVFTWFQLSQKAKCWRLTPRHNYALIMYGKYHILPARRHTFCTTGFTWKHYPITLTNCPQWTCIMSIYNIYLVWQHSFTCECAIFISTTQGPWMTDTMCLVLKIQLDRNCSQFLVSVITAADLRLSGVFFLWTVNSTKYLKY